MTWWIDETPYPGPGEAPPPQELLKEFGRLFTAAGRNLGKTFSAVAAQLVALDKAAYGSEEAWRRTDERLGLPKGTTATLLKAYGPTHPVRQIKIPDALPGKPTPNHGPRPQNTFRRDGKRAY
jgi:hypothetical protein